MKHYSISYDSYGTDSPEIIESSKLLESNYLNNDDYMYHGEYPDYESALYAYVQEKAENDYCKEHDC